MTPKWIAECEEALNEWRAASVAYAQSYDAIDRYKLAASEVGRLLIRHGPALVELALAKTVRCPCCGCEAFDSSNMRFSCECEWRNPTDVEPECCRVHHPNDPVHLVQP